MGTIDDKIQVVKGWIGDTAVETLRDTGCSGIVVRDVSLFSGGRGEGHCFGGEGHNFSPSFLGEGHNFFQGILGEGHNFFKVFFLRK